MRRENGKSRNEKIIRKCKEKPRINVNKKKVKNKTLKLKLRALFC